MTVPHIQRFMLFLKDIAKDNQLDLSLMPPNYFLYKYEVDEDVDKLHFFGQEIIAEVNPLAWGLNLSAALQNEKYPETEGFILFVCVNNPEREKDPEQDFIVAVHYNVETNELEYFEMDTQLEDYKPLTDLPTWFEDIDFSMPYVMH